MTDASPEAPWSVERLGGGEGLVRGWERCVIKISYAVPGRTGGHTMEVVEANANREVGANSEEAKLREYEI